MLRLTALIGGPVLDPSGGGLGKLEDLGVILDADHRRSWLRGSGPGEGRGEGCDAVSPRDRRKPRRRRGRGAGGRTPLASPARTRRPGSGPRRQPNRQGRRCLSRRGGEGLALVAVEVGIAPVLRRLRLGRLSRRTGDDILDWRGLHLASAPGHVLQLASGASPIHPLSAPQLEAVAETLPAVARTSSAVILAFPTGRGHRGRTLDGAGLGSEIAVKCPALGGVPGSPCSRRWWARPAGRALGRRPGGHHHLLDSRRKYGYSLLWVLLLARPPSPSTTSSRSDGSRHGAGLAALVRGPSSRPAGVAGRAGDREHRHHLRRVRRRRRLRSTSRCKPLISVPGPRSRSSRWCCAGASIASSGSCSRSGPCSSPTSSRDSWPARTGGRPTASSSRQVPHAAGR